MMSNKVAATFHPAGPDEHWRVRFYVAGIVHLTHPMTRQSALDLAATFRNLGISCVVLPTIHNVIHNL